MCPHRCSLTAIVPSCRPRPRPYDTPMRAVVLDARGEPALADVAEPAGDGPRSGRSRLRAVRLGRWRRSAAPPRARCSGTRSSPRPPTAVAWPSIHHAGCGDCNRCLAGHESTCERVRRADDRPRRLRRAGARGRLGRASRRGRRRPRNVRRAARLRAPRSRAGSSGPRARRRQRLHRAAVRGGARAPRRHRVRGRPAPAPGRRRPRRTGRCGRPLRPGRRRARRSPRSSPAARCCCSRTQARCPPRMSTGAS